ncbi:unnamed protein product [Rotaria sp. Silwood2]|nr:unnamed protein product [Rotaria sp. Silwood2]CAF4460309.1 unnamed protein product [Rotaria sp. Silwood2]
MTSLPTTTVKGRNSNDNNEHQKRLQQQRDFITNLLKHYSTVGLDIKYFKDKNNRVPFARCRTCEHTRTIYDFELEDLDLQKQSLSKYKNQLYELLNGLKYIRPGENFIPKFPLFWIIDVNGKNQHPLYEYLKSCIPSTKKFFEDHTRIFYEPHHSDDIRWNFEKFLVDSNGHPIMRFDSDAEPLFIRQFIEKLLHLNQYI